MEFRHLSLMSVASECTLMLNKLDFIRQQRHIAVVLTQTLRPRGDEKGFSLHV